MRSLQSTVDQFNHQKNLEVNSTFRILDLSSEVGEICKLGFSEGLGKKVAIEKWEEELGDALYSLLSLMSNLHIDSEKALNFVLDKYDNRLTSRNTIDSGF